MGGWEGVREGVKGREGKGGRVDEGGRGMTSMEVSCAAAT